MTKIIIDPRSNYVYGSFYMIGLWNIYGKENLHYDIKPFEELSDLGNDMRFIIKEGEVITKYFGL